MRIDGGNQPGYLVAYRAMALAIERAKQSGASIVGVHNTSHCGMAGYYVDMARKADVIGLLFVDCLPRITPEGGTEAILGTNPIAVGIPSDTVPLLFDMSTAAITNWVTPGSIPPRDVCIVAVGIPQVIVAWRSRKDRALDKQIETLILFTF